MNNDNQEELENSGKGLYELKKKQREDIRRMEQKKEKRQLVKKFGFGKKKEKTKKRQYAPCKIRFS